MALTLFSGTIVKIMEKFKLFKFDIGHMREPASRNVTQFLAAPDIAVAVNLISFSADR